MATDKLKTWLDKEGRTAAWLAKRCEMSRGSVSYWLRGLRVPSPEVRERLAMLSRGAVPARGWETRPVGGAAVAAREAARHARNLARMGAR